MPTALLSAYDKTDVTEFARALVDLGWDILASAGTAKHLNEGGVPARDVAEIVGPPILRHKVVTLSREIHAALLADESEEERAELARIGVPRIDLVYVNLYPLEDEIANPNRTLASVLEKTDIGGPTMLRSAAKGRRIVICKPVHLEIVIDRIRQGSAWDPRFISFLVAEAEGRVAQYCKTSRQFHYDSWQED